jgi:hypothetical protein
MLVLFASLLLAQPAGQLGQGSFVFSEVGSKKPAFELKEVGIWKYGETIREWLPVFSVAVKNLDSQAWTNIEVDITLGTTKGERRFSVTIDKIVEPSQAIDFEKYILTRAGGDKNEVLDYSLNVSSAQKLVPSIVKAFTGIVMIAPDCAQDYREFSALTGVKLRAAVAAFLGVECGVAIEDASFELDKRQPVIPGFIRVRFPDKNQSGWIPAGKGRTMTVNNPRSFAVEPFEVAK